MVQRVKGLKGPKEITIHPWGMHLKIHSPLVWGGRSPQLSSFGHLCPRDKAPPVMVKAERLQEVSYNQHVSSDTWGPSPGQLELECVEGSARDWNLRRYSCFYIFSVYACVHACVCVYVCVM